MLDTLVNFWRGVGDRLQWLSVALVAVPILVLLVMAFVAWSNARALAPALNTLAGNTKISTNLDLGGLI